MNNSYNWYSQLIKPTWAPPSYLFGPVWTFLYTIIFLTYGWVFYKILTKQLPWQVGVPFLLNLFFNFIFTWIQFGLRNNLLASIDVILVVVTLIWALWSIWHAAPGLRLVAYANIPYLLWGMFATCLQLTVTYLNR